LVVSAVQHAASLAPYVAAAFLPVVMPAVQVKAEHNGKSVQHAASVAATVDAAAALAVFPAEQVWKAHAPVIGVQHWVVPQVPPVHAVLATAALSVYPPGQLYVEHVGYVSQQAVWYSA